MADARRVVTPGVDPVADVVERAVTDGRPDAVVVPDDVAVRTARDVAARDGVAAETRDVVGVVAVLTVVGRADTLRVVFAAVLRFATLRADVVVDVATARDAAARPVALRGLTAVGTTGVVATASGSVSDGCSVWSDSGADISASVTYIMSGFSAAYCAIIS